MSLAKTNWSEFTLFPLFIINITTSANTWNILGIIIGQLFFYKIIMRQNHPQTRLNAVRNPKHSF